MKLEVIAEPLGDIDRRLCIYMEETNKKIKKLQEDNDLLKKQVLELIDFKLKLQKVNKKEYDWLHTRWLGMGSNSNSDKDIINWGPSALLIRQYQSGTFLETLIGGEKGPRCAETIWAACFWHEWFKTHMHRLLI